MATLTETLVKEMERYAGPGLNSRTFLLTNDRDGVYVVLGLVPNRNPVVALVAHVANDTIYIDDDRTDKPLVEALVQAGVPREKIKLVYAGEATYEIPPLAWKQPTAESTGD